MENKDTKPPSAFKRNGSSVTHQCQAPLLPADPNQPMSKDKATETLRDLLLRIHLAKERNGWICMDGREREEQSGVLIPTYKWRK